MSFQEFVDEYFGWHIDLCDLSDEDEEILMNMYLVQENK
jgi:hypothetical protein